MHSGEAQTNTISPADLQECELVKKMSYSIHNNFCYEISSMQTPAGVTFTLIRKPNTNNKKHLYGQPFIAKLRQPRGYVVYKDDKTVGYAECGFDESENFVITQLFVVDEHRKQGIGAKLLNNIEQTAAHFQEKYVVCKVDSDNAYGIDYLAKQGYHIRGIIQSLNLQNKQANVVLVKQLNMSLR
jgi:ribosomal protein S18 acetylase RimI-like enzyme